MPCHVVLSSDTYWYKDAQARLWLHAFVDANNTKNFSFKAIKDMTQVSLTWHEWPNLLKPSPVQNMPARLDTLGVLVSELHRMQRLQTERAPPSDAACWLF